MDSNMKYFIKAMISFFLVILTWIWAICTHIYNVYEIIIIIVVGAYSVKNLCKIVPTDED